MPKIDSDINAKIDDFLEKGYVSRGEARILKEYFTQENRPMVAQSLGISLSSLSTVLTTLKRNKVLCLTAERRYQLTDDPEACKKEPPPPVVPVAKVAMSEEERAWMIANYKKYKGKRSEAARILKRSKFDLCRMAIELKIDQKN